MRAITALFVLVATGCAGNSIDGDVSGVALGDDDSSSNVLTIRSGNLVQTQVEITFAGDTDDLCREFRGGRIRKDSTYLTLRLTLNGELSEGRFNVGDETRKAEANASKTDATCADTLSKGATAGFVELDTVSDESLSGTFELKFGSDEISGSFDAPTCTSTKLAATDCR